MAALAPIRDALFARARGEGRREPLEAYGAAALAQLAGMGTGRLRRSRGSSPPRSRQFATGRGLHAGVEHSAGDER